VTVNSRAKGKRGEREVAALLRAWWSQYEPDAQFASTPGSGGWSTAKMREEFRATGDICTTAQRFPFAIEVKYRQGWSLRNFEHGFASPVWGWWAQAVREAKEAKAEPMLWVRKNLEPARDERGRLVKQDAQWIILVRRMAALEWNARAHNQMCIPWYVWDRPPCDPEPVGYLHRMLLEQPPNLFDMRTDWWEPRA